MPGVHGRRLSAGVVVVKRDDGWWSFLLLRAWHNWDFPKGFVEGDESPLAAARREVREETALRDLEFSWGEEFLETGPYSRNKIARYYLAQTHTEAITLPVNPLLGMPEHHEWRWFDFAEALERVSPRLEPVLRWAAARVGTQGSAPCTSS